MYNIICKQEEDASIQEVRGADIVSHNCIVNNYSYGHDNASVHIALTHIHSYAHS